MKLHRSTINHAIDQALAVIGHYGTHLPLWACWTPSQWTEVATDPAYDEIRDCMLGWDVTDFGSDDFENIGRVLFTLRNGKHGQELYPKPYAEKLLIDPENQRAPAHFHRSKREDIICLAGGNILVQLEPAGANEKRSGKSMIVQVDGVARELPPAGIVRLAPGSSLTIPPRTIHQFWAEEGTGWALDGKRCDYFESGMQLAHFPVRSASQYVTRTIIIYTSLLAKLNKIPGEGNHAIRQYEWLKQNDFVASDAKVTEWGLQFGLDDNTRHQCQLTADRPVLLDDIVCKYHELARRNDTLLLGLELERVAGLLSDFRHKTHQSVEQMKSLF